MTIKDIQQGYVNSNNKAHSDNLIIDLLNQSMNNNNNNIALIERIKYNYINNQDIKLLINKYENNKFENR